MKTKYLRAAKRETQSLNVLRSRSRALDEDGGVAAVLSAFVPDHGLAQGLMDVERRTVQGVTDFEFAVHLVGKVMEAGVKIILVADDDNIIGGRVWHKAVR